MLQFKKKVELYPSYRLELLSNMYHSPVPLNYSHKQCKIPSDAPVLKVTVYHAY